MPDYISPDEGEIVESAQLSSNALALLNQSEHAALVANANLPGNRRKLNEFDSKLRVYASHSQPVALQMFYSLPRAGKQIIGPSIRFAEVVAPCWKNNAVGTRLIGEAENTVTAQGIFIDYESNTRNSVEVPRRITDKNGKRYADDLIVVTSNAAMSVARRNAVLTSVPRALWTPAYEEAMLTGVGKAESHAQRVANAMEYLHKLGLSEWQILNAVSVTSVKELETEHLLTLRVLCAEIKRGDRTVEEVFGSQFDKEIESLFTQLKMNQAQQTMLRNSYMGRAGDLAAYLRTRIAAPRTTSATTGTTGTVVETTVQDKAPQPNEPEPDEKQEPEPEPEEQPEQEPEPVAQGAPEPAPQPNDKKQERRGRLTKAATARRNAMQEGSLAQVEEAAAEANENDAQFTF